MFRWLVVGIGDITTKRVIPAILSEPRSELVGIVTRNPSKAESYRVASWSDLSSALETCEADAVYIGTPVFLHARQSIAALKRGRHVLCEKPMALHYAEAATMQQAGRAAGRTLGIAYYRRMYPKIERAKQLMDAGVIGRPVLAEATSHDWFYPSDGFRSWLIDPKMAGGGPIRDIACHRIDLINYLFGKPVRASGHVSTLIQPIQVEDNATILIEYECGARGMVDVRWHSRIARDEFRIRGTEGELNLTPLNSASLVYLGGSEEVPAHPNLHYPCVEEFVTAVLEGRSPRSNGESALATEWVMDEITK